MSKLAIRVEAMSKQYHIGRQKQHDTLFYGLTDMFAAPVRRTYRLLRGHAGSAAELDDTFWALRDVSFEVQQGEVVGIIGHNGAGKSTLLKILSRITEPTSGRISLWGRIASLLEVGTGFHPELTGRENVYLNGAILGMRRQEIDRKFDEIVAFSEVEQFIDTPTKHYSSGMTVRLAFAVAAHLEPEILLIDEVLAVGDVAFQRKSLGKMNDVASQGRTVLFVSHNMAAINTLCSRCILLGHGNILADGDTDDVVREYLKTGAEIAGQREWGEGERPGDEGIYLRSVRVINSEGEVTGNIFTDEDFTIEYEYEVLHESRVFNVGMHLYNQIGIHVLTSHDFTDSQWKDTPRPVGVYRSRCYIPGHLLNVGQYRLMAQLKTMPNKTYCNEYNALSFEIHRRQYPGDVFLPFKGIILPRFEWDSKPFILTGRGEHG